MSQLSIVKTRFAGITGRDDLLDGAASPDATFFINEGQKFLDRLFNRGKVEARHFVNLITGQILVPLANVRSFKSVWLYDAESRTELIVATAADLKAYYDEPVANLTSGPPEYYAPIIVRPYPKNLTSVGLNQVWAVQEMKLTGHETVNAILLMPPVNVSGTYTLEIEGLFYTDALSVDTDVSYWTETNEFLLILAAAYMCELAARNTEGANDWLKSIMTITEGLDKDIVEEQITGITSMELKTWGTVS